MNGIWKLLEKIIRFILEKTIHINISADQWNGLVQFIKFGIVGLSNTVIFQKKQWIPSIDYLVAQVIAFVLSVLWSFYWNNKYVFKQNEGQERNIFAALLKTYVSYAFTGLFLNSVLSFVWVEMIGLSKLIAPIINLLVSVPINFLMNKFWAFKSEIK